MGKRFSLASFGVLPFVYVGSGLITLFTAGTVIGYAAGLLLIAAGVFEWARARRMRGQAEASQALPASKPPSSGPDSDTHLVMIQWRPSFNCGHPVIDGQHRELFNMSNELINSVLAGKPKFDIELLLHELVEHIRDHFWTEEAVLERTGYPLSEEHREIHRVLLARARELENRYHADRMAVGDLVGYITYDVISAHIVNEDLKFALKPLSSPKTTGRDEPDEDTMLFAT